MSESVARSVGGRIAAAGAVLVLVVAVGLGALTDLGQAWLPQSSASLVNSGGSWAAVAFVLALLATGTGRAVLWGLLGLAGLAGGYYATAILRHVPESPASIRFWMLAGSTSGVYWTVQLAVAIALLIALDAWRVREPAPVVLSVVTAGVVGALTALVYLKG
jgi:hypothetical protein